MLDDVTTTPPYLAVQFLNVLGLVQSRSLESMDEAILTFRSALDIATRHDLGREAIFSMAGLSLHMQLHGDIATATVRDCLALSESMLTPYDQSLMSLRMLELEALSRRPHDASKHAVGIRDRFPVESYRWNEAVLFSAMGSLGAGDFVVAHQMSQLAADVAASKNLLAVYGAAQRVHAAACEGLNRHGLAQVAIRRAVEVLETSGSFYNLLLAYEASVRITADRRHALCVHDLRSSTFRRLQFAIPGDLNVLARLFRKVLQKADEFPQHLRAPTRDAFVLFEHSSRERGARGNRRSDRTPPVDSDFLHEFDYIFKPRRNGHDRACPTHSSRFGFRRPLRATSTCRIGAVSVEK